MPDFILIKKCVNCGEEFDRRNIDEQEYIDTQVYAAKVEEEDFGETMVITVNSCCFDCESGNEDD